MDDRRGRNAGQEVAVFAPARLATRGRPLLLAAAVVSTIGALIGFGAFGDRGADPRREVAVQPPTAATPVATSAATSATAEPAQAGWTGPVPATADMVKLDLRQQGDQLFVHGDVFSMDAVFVVVSLEERGHVDETHTARLPGGSTAFLTGANPRFDILFDLPAKATGSRWIQVFAFAGNGYALASLRQPVFPSEGSTPGAGASPKP